MKLPRIPCGTQVLIAVAIAASLPEQAASVRCNCDSFLQDGQGLTALRKPRDCTCINGMKTHATTPRDTLLGMGEAPLRGHLSACARETTFLEDQLDYETANLETQDSKSEKAIGREQKWLDKLDTRAVDKRKQQTADLEKLGKETTELEKEINGLKDSYNEHFTAWYTLKGDLATKLERIAGCKCSGAAASLLTRGLRTAAAPPAMYDLAQKVEACETQNIALSDKVEASSAKARHSVIATSDNLDTIDRKKTENQRVAKLMDKQPRIDALNGEKKLLLKMKVDLSDSVEPYGQKNDDLKKQLADLDTQLGKCGC